MIKPDGVGRRLCGEVIRRYEAKGLRLAGLKMQIVSQALAEQHYAEHVGKPFYPTLEEFMTEGPVVRPDIPTLPIGWPRVTRLPSLTMNRSRWPYIVV